MRALSICRALFVCRADHFGIIARDGVIISHFLQEPLRPPALLAPFHLEEVPFAFESFAVKPKAERACAPSRERIRFVGRECADVPTIDFARTVSAFGQHTFISQICDGVIGYLDGEALNVW